MIACPYVLYVRSRPFNEEHFEPRWIARAEYPDVIKARDAARKLRRYWPEHAAFIQYPPVGD